MIVLCVGSLDPRLFGIMLLTPSPDPGRICYDEEIEPMLQADQVCNAVATTKDGRIFVGFPHLDGSPGVKVGGVTTKVKTLIQDRRLIWVDAMWIDDGGSLWMPAAQLDRIARFQHGVSKVQFPVHIYKMQINAHPPPNDH
jgi:hypothetical protein